MTTAHGGGMVCRPVESLFAVWLRQFEAKVALELRLVASHSGCIHAENSSVKYQTKQNLQSWLSDRDRLVSDTQQA